MNLMVDIPNVAEVSAFDKPLDSFTEDKNYNDKKELSSSEDSAEKIMRKTSRTVHSMEFKQMVVKFAKEKGLRAAGRKFGISASSVRFWRWGIMAGYKSYAEDFKEETCSVIKWKFRLKAVNKPKVSKYADDFKEMVVSFGEDKGWNAAADKFGVGCSSVVLQCGLECWVERESGL
jgi:hypothetical protein